MFIIFDKTKSIFSLQKYDFIVNQEILKKKFSFKVNYCILFNMENKGTWLHREGCILTISVRVTPRARRSRIEGVWNETHLRIVLQAPPVDGQANAAVIAFLADTIGVRKNDVTLLSGTTGRCKIIRIVCATETDAVDATTKLYQLSV